MKIVLVVEDYTPLFRAVNEKFLRFGITAVQVVSYDEATKYLVEHAENIGLVWLDHYLIGEKTGLDVLAFMKDKNNMKDIPVLAVSNESNHDRMKQYKALGAKEYYIKVGNRLAEIAEEAKKLLSVE
ncbi:MAG: response regulator [Patescibacteria group bacterium]